jgi:CheY-like chemotaxis protein
VAVDLNMPGMNGVELCMNINTLPERTRPIVVAMSGRYSCDDLALLRTLHVYEVLNKDEGFLPRMCDVIGDVRRARLSAKPSPHARSRREV